MVGREGSRCSTSFLVSSHGLKFYLKFQKSFILLTFLRVCHRVSFPAPSRPIPFEWTCILAVFLNGPLPGRGALAALLRDRGRLGPGTGDPLPTLLCDVAQHLLGAPAEAAPLLGQGGGKGSRSTWMPCLKVTLCGRGQNAVQRKVTSVSHCHFGVFFHPLLNQPGMVSPSTSVNTIIGDTSSPHPT